MEQEMHWKIEHSVHACLHSFTFHMGSENLNPNVACIFPHTWQYEVASAPPPPPLPSTQLQVPDRGQSQTPPASSKFQWAIQEPKRKFQIAVSQPEGHVRSNARMIKCLTRCETDYHKKCQRACQTWLNIRSYLRLNVRSYLRPNVRQDVRSNARTNVSLDVRRSLCQTESQTRCQKACQIWCKERCQNSCQIESQKRCQQACQVKCQKFRQT